MPLHFSSSSSRALPAEAIFRRPPHAHAKDCHCSFRWTSVPSIRNSGAAASGACGSLQHFFPSRTKPTTATLPLALAWSLVAIRTPLLTPRCPSLFEYHWSSPVSTNHSNLLNNQFQCPNQIVAPQLPVKSSHHQLLKTSWALKIFLKTILENGKTIDTKNFILLRWNNLY